MLLYGDRSVDGLLPQLAGGGVARVGRSGTLSVTEGVPPAWADSLRGSGYVPVWGLFEQAATADPLPQSNRPGRKVRYVNHLSTADLEMLTDGTENGSVQTTQKTTQKTTQERILNLLRQQPTLTRKILAERIGITPDGIKYHLDKLRSAGQTPHVGTTKRGRWEIIEGKSAV